jgi:hypothetical protein
MSISRALIAALAARRSEDVDVLSDAQRAAGRIDDGSVLEEDVAAVAQRERRLVDAGDVAFGALAEVVGVAVDDDDLLGVRDRR